jgi:hypothetical protein
MPRPLQNTGLWIEDGNKKTRVTDDPKILMGWIEGTWWVKYSWWVIPLGLVALILPWVLLAQSCGSEAPASNVLSPSATIEEKAPSRGYDVIVVPEPTPDPGPASTPPPAKTEVIEKEKRIYRVSVRPR